MQPAPRTVDTKEVVAKWVEKFNKGVLSLTHFKEYWRTWVPRLYSPSLNESSLNWSFNEDEAHRVLFSTLEQFICEGDPTMVLNQLSQLDKPPSVCGKVFKMGDPTYSCRECGMDNTCVLCAECFKRSEHRHHKYKMATSGGGGCCDCGDKEAWKKDPFCDIHIVGTQSEGNNGGQLPEDLAERTRIVFNAVLWYAYNLLTYEHTADLGLRDSDDDLFDIDTYCTVLYNDEVHTFEQVITTLTRILKCSQRNAIEFVTNIDREGRAVVKCSTFQHCNDLKSEIEKFTSRHGKPLKALVVHAHAVAHQLFAMKLLSWLQVFLSHGEGFRSIFAEVALKPQGADPCIIKGIMLRDSQLWKSARTQWHRLFISGMLLEYENKKALAKVFTKNYGSIMKDFIKDDHDHSFSVASLSVQLFTTPTLAHHLIANDDILFILLNTFISECTRKCNKARKLEFERNSVNPSFKRAQYMLYDLRYLLSAVPETWTDHLRKSFLQGLSVMLNLLTMMQGMDSVTRQVGQHMEYEPEWESAFNLHTRLAHCISLALKWCGTDRIVLIKAYRATLKKLYENPCYDPNEALETRELADHSVACLHYDVSSKPVCIHLPLTRFLAGLHLHLEKYNLHFDGPEFQTPKPTPVQIIEPVLRAQVMVAQVHAGMWRRNGYALLNQLYLYHNVKCRTEMLDRDIMLLQIGASLIESNELLIHILNKFNLLNWAMNNFEINSLKSNEEDSMRQTVNLVEEFLQLIIVVVGERYVPGISNVTTQDRIKKEIIQQLCIKPLPHSELNKAIPDEIAHDTALDDVIEELAAFKKPSHGSGKGVYELKSEFYKEYNVFFYHYTREELSKSEETQRKRRKSTGKLECCPPPQLPKLNESFSMIVNLLQCDVMLHVMQIVLERCKNLRARSFSELQLHKVLHLISYALQEEESKQYPFFLFTEKANKFNILSLLEEVVNCPRVEAHKDMLRWVISKYKTVAKISDPSEPSTSKESSGAVVTCTEPEVDDEKERRAKLAAQKRAKIMAQMTAMQKSFMKENAKLFEETSSELNVRGNADLHGSAMDVSEPPDEEQPIALGAKQTARVSTEKTFICILCQEEEQVTITGSTLVLAAFVQQATVLCQHRNNESLLDVSTHDPLYLNSNLGPAPHTSTCGHVMHSSCWRKYFDNVMLKEHRRPYRLRHPASFDVDKQEFLCPLCECLSNTVLPLVPPLHTLQPVCPKNEISFNDWLHAMICTLNKKISVCHGIFKCNETCKNIHCKACTNASDGSAADSDYSTDCEADCSLQTHQVFYSFPKDVKSLNLGAVTQQFAELFPTFTPNINETLENYIIHLFTQAIYTRGLSVHHHPTDKRVAPMTWKSLSYTIHAIEVLLRDSNKPLLGHLSSRHRDCLESFVRVVGVLGTTWKRTVVITSHALHLLTILLEHSDQGPSVLQWDSLGILIPLTFSLPSLFAKDSPVSIPTGGTLELHTLHLVFLAHIVKVVILLDVNLLDDSMDTDSNEEQELMEVLKMLNKTREGLSMHTVWKHVQKACIPFLRCCVLFYHYLTDVPAPSTLLEVGGDTFNNMCTYLGLPQTPKELFTSKAVFDIVGKWCNHEEVGIYLNGAPLLVSYEPLPIPHLIDLPVDYSELMNSVLSSFSCPNSDHDDARNPTMCLVCGEILCSQSYCCQTELNKVVVGACNYHAYKCGTGVGIFLRVRECEILFLASPHRGCFALPPYLDDYGETDQGLRRGNPLKLCPEKYKKLQTLWLSHSIHEEIARAIESSTSIVTTQWHHL